MKPQTYSLEELKTDPSAVLSAVERDGRAYISHEGKQYAILPVDQDGILMPFATESANRDRILVYERDR